MIRDDSALGSNPAETASRHADRRTPRLLVILVLAVLSWIVLGGLVCIVYFLVT